MAALLRPQNTHGRNRRRSHCGQEAGQDSGSEQNGSDRNECGEVECLYTEKKALHCAADEIGADQAESQPDGGKEHTVTNDETDEPIACGAESHAERDFMRALGHGKRHDTIDAKTSENRATAAKLEKRISVNRWSAMDSSTTSSRVLGSARATLESTWCTAAEMLVSIVDGFADVRTAKLACGQGIW